MMQMDAQGRGLVAYSRLFSAVTVCSAVGERLDVLCGEVYYTRIIVFELAHIQANQHASNQIQHQQAVLQTVQARFSITTNTTLTNTQVRRQ